MNPNQKTVWVRELVKFFQLINFEICYLRFCEK